MIDGEGFPESKVHVIANGVDIERFAPRTDREQVRASLGISPSAPTAGIVAALRPEKNHELFLRSARRVIQAIPEARFVIVGDGPERNRLERMAAQWGITPAVIFLGTRADIAELLGALDVFTLTSQNEANPVSILEAMAMGLPVVATRVGSIAETVGDGLTGLLVEPGAEEELVISLIKLFRQGEEARAMGRAGRAEVMRKGSLPQMVRGYAALISGIYASNCARSISSAGAIRCYD